MFVTSFGAETQGLVLGLQHSRFMECFAWFYAVGQIGHGLVLWTDMQRKTTVGIKFIFEQTQIWMETTLEENLGLGLRKKFLIGLSLVYFV